MKNANDSETNAAVETASRELIGSALQRNPLVAAAAALVGPIIGLCRGRRPRQNEVNQLKLEAYSSKPAGPAAPPDRRRDASRMRTQCEGSANGVYPECIRVRSKLYPSCIQVRSRLYGSCEADTKRIRRNERASAGRLRGDALKSGRAQPGKGGLRHG